MANEVSPRASARRFALGVALLTAAAYALLVAAGAVLWLDLKAFERDWLTEIAHDRGPFLALLLLLVPAAIAGVLRLGWAAYPAALRRLADQARLARSVRPPQCIDVRGAAEVREVAAEIERLAQAYGESQLQVQTRIDEAHVRLAQEKNQLAALMSELAQSVLVCNREGRILLYNDRASRLLGQSADGDVPLGLGRSIFSILDRSPLLHAMDQLAARLEHEASDPVAHFVTTRGGQLLRAQMAPVLDEQRAMAGFVVVLEDVTRSVEKNARRDELLQRLTVGSRSALANIRAAAETLQQYPDMDDARRDRFVRAIDEEAHKLSDRIESALAAQDAEPPASWPREDLSAADLVEALRRSLPAGPRLTAEVPPQPLWLNVDSYALVQALALLAQRLAGLFQLASLGLVLEPHGRWVRLSLVWQGAALDAQALHEMEDAPLSLGRAAPWSTLWEVLQQHGAEMWSLPSAGGPQRLCLQLPATQPEQRTTTVAFAPGRPVSYDFDLFAQQDSALDDRPLSDLACTVFDTEATGMSPSEGDEIIAIGAVRVLNGRLLQQESFDRLVRPRRAVRREAQAVHGISQEMLADQPMLEDVLPSFHRFAHDTVLVGHNAAFDMRLLQLARPRTGLAFDQPVLDTLLLSALVQPGHADAEHRLEAIAARLGVPIVGRHTALGDALMTAEVFLKLLPLLAERGIRTLRQAREASQQTLYAKLEY